MSRTDHRYEILDGQNDFRGGMLQVGEPTESQYRYAENMVCRRGWIETRPGMRRTSRAFNEGFFFNEENAKFNDATHTGFWFNFDFVGLSLGDIQGAAFFRFLADTDVRQVIVSDGKVYAFSNGVVSTVATAEAIGVAETIEFIQANQQLVMLRDEGLNPMRWDGSSAGFVLFDSSSASTTIPLSSTGAYAGGRLWVVKDRDDIYASDIFDIDTYDYLYQTFSAQKGDGDEITRLIPYHDDYLLVFKKRSVYALSGVKFAANQAAFDVLPSTPVLSDYVTISQVFNNHGLVAPKCVIVHGEQVTFLSYEGIVSISRTQEGQLQGLNVTLSAPIQPVIDRINWRSVTGACAGSHENYLFFAVPLDDSTVNNAVLVYDMEIDVWVGIWNGALVTPTDFFNDKEALIVLNSDGAFRQWFTDDPWDTNTVFDDTQRYDSTDLYQAGELVYNGSDTIYQALVENINVAISDTDTWAVVADPQNLHQIESTVWTRYYRHNDEASPKRYSRAQLLYRHQNPSISVDIEDRDYGTSASLFSGITYDRTVYDVDNKAQQGQLAKRDR